MTLKCTMILGDCLEVLPTLPRGLAHMVFADLPYGITGFSWDKKLNSKALRCGLDHALKVKYPIIFTANESFMFQIREEWGQRVRYMLIWDKSFSTGAFHAHRRPMVTHEYIMILGDTPTYNAQKTTGHPVIKKTGERLVGDFIPNLAPLRSGRRLDLDATRHPGSILRFPRDRRVRRCKSNNYSISTHPSQKPVELVSWLIRSYTNVGDTIIDPCGGSGTAAISSLSCGRNIVLVENDPKYFDASVNRVKSHIRDNLIRAEIEVRR